MPFWRRRKPLHEELAEGTGLLEWQSRHETGPKLFEGTLDVLHGGRQREWAAVATAEAPDLEDGGLEFPEEIDGDTVDVVVQGDERTLLVDELPTWAEVRTLESFARERQRDFVLHAERLDGELWAVRVNAL